MAKIDYDQFAGLWRLAEAARTIDQRTAVILTYHAALEREMGVVLAKVLPRADRLKRFGFGHKVDVLAASWKGSELSGDRIYDVLLRFNELRNAVAHGDRPELVEGCLARLLLSYRTIFPDADDHIEIGAMAAGICGFMADGPPPQSVKNLFVGLRALDGGSDEPEPSNGPTAA